VLSPIDLLPEFLPVIGPLDDIVAVVLLLRYAAAQYPVNCSSRHGQLSHGFSNGSSRPPTVARS